MEMKNLEIRQLQQVSNTEDSIVEGYALKFDKPSEDLGGFIEFINKRALDNVDLSDVRLFVDHDPSKLLGRTRSGTLKLAVDEVGLKFRASLPETTLGKDTMQLVQRGDLNQCSFGFTVERDNWTKVEGVNHRSIEQVGKLMEISLVSIPAYEDTDVRVAQRSLENASNELELRKVQLELDLLALRK